MGTWHRALAQSVAPSPNLPAVLTLEDALRIFRTHGLDLIMAETAVQSAEGDLRIAGAVPNPVLGPSYSHTFTYQPRDPSCAESNATCSVNGFGVDLSDQGALLDILSGKRGLRLRVARAALAAARQNRVDAERNLDFLVKQQYLQASLAAASLAFAIDAQASATKTFDLSHLRYQKGPISEPDEARVEAAKLESDQAVATARQALKVAKHGLAVLLGVRGELPQFEVPRDLPRFQIPAPLAAPTLESLLRDAIDHRPDLKGQRLQVDRAEASVALAKRLRVPDIALDANYQQMGMGGKGTNAPLTPPTLTLGLSVPLPLFYRQQGEIGKARADVALQDAQRARMEAQILNDVGAALANFATSKEKVERMEARLLERSRRARDLVEIQYLRGAASLLEFLDAQRTYIATNVEYLNNLADYWRAVFQMEQAVGRELR